MQTLYFVRHGTSEFNVARRFGGITDTPLAPEGYEEARLAAERALALRIDCIVTSPLSRCRTTAKIIAEHIGYPADQIILSELLIERYFGPLEGTPLRLLEPDELGVETEEQMAERAERAQSFISSLDATHVLVCSHGVFGRMLRSSFHPQLALLEQAPDTRPAPIPNAVITCWQRSCSCCDHEELVAI